MLNSKLLGGTAAGKTYIEDVFSTWLYTGTGATQTITNGIDLSGKGGMVWIKSRSNAATSHALFDTARGAAKQLSSNATSAETTTATGGTSYNLTAFNNTGFSLGGDWDTFVNGSTYTYASWTFRKAAKFFDVVSYTGSGANRTIAHSLGSVPGTIIVKRTDTTGNWNVYHRSLGATKYLLLENTQGEATASTVWNDTQPTASVFSVGTYSGVNASGGTYVAYLFAHDAGGFGDSGNDSVVSCGSYTGNGSTTGPTVSLGWEPQWLLIKRTDAAGENWFLVDSMRGLTVPGSDDEYLLANASSAAFSTSFIAPLATGFQLNSTSGAFNASGGTYIYIAIRRGPMRTPTDATKVFSANTASTDNTNITTNFPVDMLFDWNRAGSIINAINMSRLMGNLYLSTCNTNTTSANSATDTFQSNTWVKPYVVGAVGSVVLQSFRRAPGFFDVVAFLGNAASRTLNHNLAAVPELMIFKCRDAALGWGVYSAALAASENLVLQTDAAKASSATIWDNTRPTSTVFSVGANSVSNANNGNMIAYLFATCPGVSKVGSYTGSGTTKQIDCGFTAGARFVLIKRTDSTGDWYVWDTARGIVSGNDPYLLLNSTAAEVTNTDYIDPLNSGFEISSTAPAAINANGGTFIYLAIA